MDHEIETLRDGALYFHINTLKTEMESGKKMKECHDYKYVKAICNAIKCLDMGDNEYDYLYTPQKAFNWFFDKMK